MIVIWEEKDVIVGRKFVSRGASEIWMIGYIPTIAGECKYVLISLNNGMVTEPKLKCELAVTLNNNNSLPVELV